MRDIPAKVTGPTVVFDFPDGGAITQDSESRYHVWGPNDRERHKGGFELLGAAMEYASLRDSFDLWQQQAKDQKEGEENLPSRPRQEIIDRGGKPTLAYSKPKQTALVRIESAPSAYTLRLGS